MTATVQGMNLTKIYPMGNERVYALDNASLEVQPGDMIAVVGRSGSGKSTLLHTLGCLQSPDSGQLWFDGQDVTQLGDDQLAQIRTQKVGFMFQAFNLVPSEIALKNVELPLKQQKIDAWNSRLRAEEALELVGLGNRFGHRLGQLSTRQRQCVALARALVTDPAVIFADEPTRALDGTSREELMGLFQKLNDDGKTIVIATSDSAIANYCRRVVKIAYGSTLDVGQVEKRRIIPPSRIPGPPLRSYQREVTVCPRCNYGNFKDQPVCTRCEWPLDMTEEEEQSIESRLSGADPRHQGVESANDKGKVPGQKLVDELKNVPFFTGLGAKSLAKVIPAMEQRQFAEGFTILRQGDEGDAFYILTKGEVQVWLERDGRQPVPIAKLGPNEGFGEMALLTDQPRSATVVALTDVEAWHLSKMAFSALLSENLSLGLYFNRILSQRLRALQDQIVA